MPTVIHPVSPVNAFLSLALTSVDERGVCRAVRSQHTASGRFTIRPRSTVLKSSPHRTTTPIPPRPAPRRPRIRSGEQDQAEEVGERAESGEHTAGHRSTLRTGEQRTADAGRYRNPRRIERHSRRHAGDNRVFGAAEVGNVGEYEDDGAGDGFVKKKESMVPRLSIGR